MKYYAYLKQEGEGCDYTIGCGNTLITLNAENDKNAKEKLKEIIIEQYSERESMLEKAILFKETIDFDLKSVYDDVKSKKEDEKKSRQHIKDMEEFERLKRKLGK